MRKIACLMIVAACLFTSSCSKEEKVGKLEISQVEYTLEQNPEKVTVSLDVKGFVKNISPYDVRRIVITGRCTSCTEVMQMGKWFVTQAEYDKSPSQFAHVGYLLPGGTAEFMFKGIAYFFKASPNEQPESYPDGLEVYIESFETVQN